MKYSAYSPLSLLGLTLCLGLYALPSIADDDIASTIQMPEGSKYKNCLLYNDAPCPGSNTNLKAITEYRRSHVAEKTLSAAAGGGKLASAAIDLANVCRWVDGLSGRSSRIFVPFRTNTEWLSFVNGAPAKEVTLRHCARPSVVSIPANDPARSDSAYRCLVKTGSESTTLNTSFSMKRYGRTGSTYDQVVTGVTFKCWTPDGKKSWTKTARSIKVKALNADSAGLSTDYYKAHPCNGAACESRIAPVSDWKVVSIRYDEPAIDGKCGSAHNKSFKTAPRELERCTTGSSSNFKGSGPWTWKCKGYYAGKTASGCKAKLAVPSCPPLYAWGPYHPMIGRPAQPAAQGVIYLKSPGNFGQKNIYATSGPQKDHQSRSRYYGNSCRGDRVPGYYHRFGRQYRAKYLVQCASNIYIRKLAKFKDLPLKNPIWSNCTVGGGYLSPVKVNFAGDHAEMNSTGKTKFKLTLKDGRILKGYGEGGLNPGEGWLMVRRSGPLYYKKSGMLNGDNWFGDRDDRSLNGYTDLAETFVKFLKVDQDGQRYIPLRKLGKEERKDKQAAYTRMKGKRKITDPSIDLRIIDAKNKELLASDYFSRIYVDYVVVNEYDGKSGTFSDSKNAILGRSTVTDHEGRNFGSVDQWFILDIPGDYVPTDKKTKSKIIEKRR